jgi:hypothetical protein
MQRSRCSLIDFPAVIYTVKDFANPNPVLKILLRVLQTYERVYELKQEHVVEYMTRLHTYAE